MYCARETRIGPVLTSSVAAPPDVPELSEHSLLQQLIVAEREAMEAKAEYELRNRITHNVLIMDPVLKAVHGDGSTDNAEE